MLLLLYSTLFSLLCAKILAENNSNKRLDCHLENNFNLNKDECKQRGCIWDSSVKIGPVCFLDTKKVGYKYVGKQIKTSNGLKADLQLKGTAKQLLTSMKQIARLKLEVIYLTDSIVRFKIYDPNKKRYEVPIQKTFPLLNQNIRQLDEKSRKYSVKIEMNTDFNIKIMRKQTKIKIFDTSIGGLIFSDQLLQISTYLPTKNIYGLGENTHQSFRHKLDYQKWSLFARGIGPDPGVFNLYGVHPFYTCLENDGKSHGILFLNSNSMEYTLLPEPAITFKTTGGILDFFVFIGKNPEHVLRLYTSLIGRPFLPAFWSLGFQLTRYGYRNTANVRQVLQRNINAKIPLDVMYVDIDYMSGYRTFTYDKRNFTGLPELMASTKKLNKVRWSLILDPGIEGNNSQYTPFSDGYINDVYIKWPKSVKMADRHNPPDAPTDTDIIYGKVWPKGPVAFPDFFKSKTAIWWQRWISHMYKKLKLKVDGLWIDMNEPFNFGAFCPINKYDYPKAWIQSVHANVDNNQLSNFTLCMVTVQGENGEYIHYDVHSLYALTQSIVTQKVVHKTTGKRGFLLSRSSYVSSGRYTAHWLGDNTSRWSHMRDSIIGILEFNLFAMNFVGADICGFFKDSTPELCRRWSQLGAFYTFSRNHNELLPIDQDPAVWAQRGSPEVTEAAKNSLNFRYSLLHYLYTLFFRANCLGETVIRPLFHEFPYDKHTHGIDKQFMWGKAVLISPFLYKDQKTVKAYLPKKSIWYSTWPKVKKFNQIGFVDIPDFYPTGPPPIHFRGGNIIPMTTKTSHPNTESVRSTGITLIVLPNDLGTATGELFWDDGESIDSVEKGVYNYYTFEFQSDCQLVINVNHFGYSIAPNIHYIRFYDIFGTKNNKCVLDSPGSSNSKKITAGPIDKNRMVQLKFAHNLMDIKSAKKVTIKCTGCQTKY